MKLRLLGLALCALAFQNCSKSPVKIAAADADVPGKTATNAACYSNPIISFASGDPYCFKYSGTYYMYRPENGTVIYNTSTDLVNWTSDNQVSYTNATGGGVWAPEVHNIDGTLYLIHAVPNGTGPNGRDIKVCQMVSPTSTGNNTPVTLVGNGEINIDPSVYQEGSDYYLLWKNVGNAAGDNSRIKIRKLKASDPTQFATGSSSTTIIPDNANFPLNKEHPYLIREDYDSGTKFRYFLFYNNGVGETQDYKVSYATSSTLLGTYTNKGVMMQKNAARNIYSLGGHSIVRDANNYRWIVYRAKTTAADGWDGRKPFIDRLFVNATENTASCEPTRTQSAYCPAN